MFAHALRQRTYVSLIFAMGVLMTLLFVRQPRDVHDDAYETAQAPPAIADLLRFREVATERGLVYAHRYTRDQERKPGQARANPHPSISVADVNQDGRPDFFIPHTEQGEANLLYVQQADGRFVDQAREYGLAFERQEQPGSMALFADFNRDGLVDLVLAQWGCSTYFRGQGPGQVFIEEPHRMIGYCSRPEGVNALDFDRDGDLDLVFGNFIPPPNEGRYFSLWMSSTRQDNTTGGRNDLLRFDGEAWRLDEAVNFKSRSYTHTVGVSDINRDNFPDVVFSNDYSYDEMFLNQAGRSVLEVTDEYIPKRSHGFSGMNTEFADFNGDGRLDLFITNVHKPGFYRRHNTLWRQREDHRYEEVAMQLGVGRCGFAWAGKFADFDLDGDLDLMVVNGRERSEGLQRPEDGESLWYRRVIAAEIIKPLKSVYWEAEEKWGKSYISAFERSCLFTQHEGRFYDVAEAAGVADRQEGRGLALVDFNNDGRMDFVTVSMKGNLQLYENQSPTQGDWLGVDLRLRSGGVAWGAWAELRARAASPDSSVPKFVRELYPANGFRAQSDWRLHFGLGRTRSASPAQEGRKPDWQLEVKWPDGEVEVFENLKLGAYSVLRQGEGSRKALP
ncbi:MAG TPA: CRTAC1 family protein [Pseudobdellovibrionaceae bacterium]|nr:CRTAC1 family protein [Pseudobdellovibrionaceae bacterium]